LFGIAIPLVFLRSFLDSFGGFAMKKIFSAVLILVLAFGLLAGCGTAPAKEAAAAPKLRIVTTIFPIYDWVMNVLGEQAANAEVTMLLDNGVDLHSYQPTADDIVRISTCDLFIYVGGESDEWVEDALQEVTNKNMVVIKGMTEPAKQCQIRQA
jgi:zinc transport system substrate-binding protein